jgi:hypothetical protein
MDEKMTRGKRKEPALALAILADKRYNVKSFDR